ncbi:hypothetical protein CEP88_03890 [Roseobacter denitrificans]|uniref:Uncharacterized protein n=1 Tax=Roseobacter denitrificans (strain ATCC 33942 / OCh 114) TaxID=375451 RepID=Q165J8_ROSDO|nr:hypothetical protein [Roseobacter denitrificans]ABG32345.1 hypothetical protein RD1_2817 [Roseobacter denitrificans OCh 114]AVL51824.1 hypothetical protein CEP88_03890 [Roseobacter denitrificans]SFF80614.1 hypothetical protein SAMN05443635_102310 [Roseobacter denitrificans OCh 114]
MSLDAQLLAAHAEGDTDRLVTLYAQAAASADDPDTAGFYLTHAYVFALEAGLPQAADLRAQLIETGREEPL